VSRPCAWLAARVGAAKFEVPSNGPKTRCLRTDNFEEEGNCRHREDWPMAATVFHDGQPVVGRR
jgi:hypothetical protein